MRVDTVSETVSSTPVVGWAIGSSPAAALATNALRMAIDNRQPHLGTVIHSDHGVQGGFNSSSQYLDHKGVRWGVKEDSYLRRLRERDANGPRIEHYGLRCRSPGCPEPSRAVQRDFWRRIASGATTAETAQAVGVSWPIGARWFRHAGGMAPISLNEPTGRYLSFSEREEIALLCAQKIGGATARTADQCRRPLPCIPLLTSG